MKSLFTFLFLAVATVGLAQKNDTTFFKKDVYTLVPRDSADFFRVITQPDPATRSFIVTDFYKNGKRKLEGKAVSDKPLALDGEVTAYFENGNKQKVSTYKSGGIVGTEYLFFSNGKPYITQTYTGKKHKTTWPDEVLIVSSFDTLGTPTVTNSNGVFKVYDKLFKNIIEQGSITNGKRTGEWKFEQDFLSRVQTYDADGEIISGKALNSKTGETATYTQDEVLPSFPGGMQAFNKYLVKNIKYPKYEFKKNIGGRVVLQFVVERDGRITDVKVVRHVTPDIDNEAVRVIENSPVWSPGIQYGFPVRAQFTQSIGFATSSE